MLVDHAISVVELPTGGALCCFYPFLDVCLLNMTTAKVVEIRYQATDAAGQSSPGTHAATQQTELLADV